MCGRKRHYRIIISKKTFESEQAAWEMNLHGFISGTPLTALNDTDPLPSVLGGGGVGKPYLTAERVLLY